MSSERTSEEWLRELLNLFWLRPENGLTSALRAESLESVPVEHPSIDVSCGDGTFSFVTAGGSFDREFDVFAGAANLDEFFDDVDIFDSAPEEYDPKIRTQPDWSYTVGTDHKPALLEKASRLGFYDELVEHDNEKPMPVETNRFRFAYTNAAHWIDNVDLHLSELARITDPDGKVALHLKTHTVYQFLEYLRSEWTGELGEELIDMIDRGRSDHYETLDSKEGWTRRLEDAGFDVQSVEPVIGLGHIQMWDIGLRPISPHLIRMAHSVEPERRKRIKIEWLDTWGDLLDPFMEPGFSFASAEEAAEYLYVASPRET